MMKDNLSTIKYLVSDVNFKYHIAKSELKKDSLISKRTHPLEEVEKYKLKLINKNLLKDYNKDYYILKKTIRIGGLMAYNLYSGEIKEKFEINYPIVVNTNDNKIKYGFEIKNVIPTDSILHNNVNMGAYKLKKISKLNIDFNFISEQDGNSFSPVENLIKELLIKYSYINKQARHGLSEFKECDIVDETSNTQIEVVTEFKNRLKKDKTPQKNIEMLIVECVDNNIIETSDALIKKYIKKDYTSKYEKQLAIFCVGSQQAVTTMLKKLEANLKEQIIKNHFSKLYILFYDLVKEEYYWYPTPSNGVEKVDNILERIVYKTNINYKEMYDDEKYLIECNNIFNSSTTIAYLTGKEIKEYANEIELIID